MTSQKDLEKFVKEEVYVCMSFMVEELLNCSTDFQEVYYQELEKQSVSSDWLEVWSVSDDLAEELKNEDEFVFEYAWHNLWFRKTSGQAIYLDGVIQDIYNNICTRAGLEE